MRPFKDMYECESMCKSYFMRQYADGYICGWLQKNVDPSIWCSYFKKELEAYYVSKIS
jgi:hypothetical protein